MLTEIEAVQLVGKMVRLDPVAGGARQGAGRHWGKARLLGVDGKYGVVQPVGHGKPERVLLRYIKNWFSANDGFVPDTGEAVLNGHHAIADAIEDVQGPDPEPDPVLAVPVAAHTAPEPGPVAAAMPVAMARPAATDYRTLDIANTYDLGALKGALEHTQQELSDLAGLKHDVETRAAQVRKRIGEVLTWAQEAMASIAEPTGVATSLSRQAPLRPGSSADAMRANLVPGKIYTTDAAVKELSEKTGRLYDGRGIGQNVNNHPAYFERLGPGMFRMK